MSTTVDERVVKMEFENKNFEKSAKTSINTINKLKESLNFNNIVTVLTNSLNLLNKTDLSSISKEVESVKVSFSALQIVAATALSNIANSAVNVGKNLVSSLSIDQITAGWSKYDQKTSSVQTIMNATGKSLDEVNGYLNKLMWYSDETSYGFTDMTSALAQLTSSGGDIEKLIPMIMGVANATAYAGKGASEFSRAMYNLNQSYTAGKLQYMDWKSLEMAGVASKQLKQSLIDAAIELGKISEGEVNLDNFSSTLASGWADREVMEKAFGSFTDLTEAVNKAVENGYAIDSKGIRHEVNTATDAIEILSDQYSDLGSTAFKAAQSAKTFSEAIGATKDAVSSGWMKTFELIFGNYEEAKQLWSDLAGGLWDVFASGAEKRNEILEKTLSKSGWDDFLDKGIANEKEYTWYIEKYLQKQGDSLDSIIEKEGSLKKAFANGSISINVLSDALSDMANSYEEISDEELKNLGYTKEQIERLKELSKEVQNGSISIDSFFGKLSGRELLLEGFYNIGRSFIKIFNSIKESFSSIFGLNSEKLYNSLKSFSEFTKKLIITDDTAEKLKRTFTGIFSIFDIILSVIKILGKSIFRIFSQFSNLGKSILGVTASFGDFITKIRESVKSTGSFTLAIQSLTDNLINFIKEIKEKIGSFSNLFNWFFGIFNGLLNFIKNIFYEIKNAISSVIDSVGKGQTSIFEVFTALFTGAALYKILEILKKLSSFSTEFIKSVTKPIAESIYSLTDSLEYLCTGIKIKNLVNISLAIAMLSASILVLASIKSENLYSSISAIVISLTAVLGAMAVLNKINKSSLSNTLSNTLSLISISFAILVVASSLKILSTLSWDDIGRSLTAMVGALSILVSSLYVISLISKYNANKNSKTLKTISFVLLILAASLKILSTMSWDDIGRSLTAMAGALLILSGTLEIISLINNKSNASKNAKSLFVISLSLMLIASSLKILSTMSWDDIGRSLTAMGVSLGLLVSSLYLVSLISKKSILGRHIKEFVGLSILLFSLSLSLKLLGSMSWNEIGKGIFAMVGALGILVTSLIVMQKMAKGPQLILFATSLVILVSALALLVPVLGILGSMSWESLGKGLLSLSIAIGVFAASALLLKNATPIILSFSVSLIAFGIAITLIGTGIALISTGISSLIIGITSSMSLIISFVKGIISLIPFTIGQIGLGLLEFCKVIIQGAPIIGEAIASVILSSIKSLSDIIPDLTEGLLKILVGILDSFNNYIPQILNSLINFLINLIGSISKFLPKLVIEAVKILSEFFDSIINELKNVDPESLIKTILSVGALAALLIALSSINSLVPSAMLGVIGLGAFIAELALVLTAIGALTKIPGLKELIDNGGNLLQSIGNAIGKFIGGIAGGISEGFSSSLPNLANNLSRFMTNLKPFINGLSSIDSKLIQSSKHFVELMLMVTATKLINQLSEFLTGGNTFDHFSNQLKIFGIGLNNFASVTSGINSSKVSESIKLGTDLAKMAANMPVDGILKRWKKNKNFDDFSKNICSFGTSMVSFNDIVSKINCKQMSELVSIFNSLITGLDIAINNSGNLGIVSKGFISFGFSIKSLFNNINSLNNVDDVVQTLLKISNGINSFNPNSIFNISDAIKKIIDTISNGIDDSNLTIRPVLDLTNVKSGIDNMNAMLNSCPYIGTIGRAESINSIMNHNLDSSNADILSAIRDLSNKLDNMSSNTYNINGITYDDGSNIQEAVKQIVRAARIERRI